MKTIESVDKKICTGCGACFNACPKGAISMVKNKEGFLYPVIDRKKCINCGICYAKCAAVSVHYNNEKNPKCYAVWANDEIRMKSSSGGMFTLMANYVLEKGGYVCGAAWDKEFNVEHIVIHDQKDLDKLRYSKYVQSNTRKAYSETEKLLKQSKTVLFTGTPCQIAGLKAFLGKEYDQLITADVVCHGTPSQQVWQDFLNSLPYRDKIQSVNFRPKEDGWGVFKLTFGLNDGSIRKLERTNPYFAGFEKALFYRQSCGSCPFNHLPRQADITLGDFWGIEFYDKPLRHPKGTSCVMVNNEKGQKILEAVQSQMTLIKEKPLEESVKYNKCFYMPTSINEQKRHRFFKLRESYSFEKAVDYALHDKFDIGVVGIFFSENYGAVLTGYALYKFLENLGYRVLLIDASGFIKDKAPSLEASDNLSRRFFMSRCTNITRPYASFLELSALNARIENFVLASDQLWHFPKPFGKTFFLDFVKDNKRKIAIATSFGENYIDPISEWPESVFHMRRLDRISVREDTGVDICQNVFGVTAEHILDPVFLCDMKYYDLAIKKSQKNETSPYLLAYILDKTPEKEKAVTELAHQLKLKLVLIVDANRSKFGEEAQKNVSVEDWLYYFKNATAVVTDSFHGTCFSFIFRKPFIAWSNPMRGASRFTSLLKIFREEERLIYNADQLNKKVKLLSVFNVKQYSRILEQQKNKSIQWIKEALTFENKKSVSVYDLQQINALTAQKDIRCLQEEMNAQHEILLLALQRRQILFDFYKFKFLRAVSFGKNPAYKIKYQEAKDKKNKIKLFLKDNKI